MSPPPHPPPSSPPSQPPTFSLRPATKSDIPRLAQIHVAACLPDPAFSPSLPHPRRLLSRRHRHARAPGGPPRLGTCGCGADRNGRRRGVGFVVYARGGGDFGGKAEEKRRGKKGRIKGEKTPPPQKKPPPPPPPPPVSPPSSKQTLNAGCAAGRTVGDIFCVKRCLRTRILNAKGWGLRCWGMGIGLRIDGRDRFCCRRCRVGGWFIGGVGLRRWGGWMWI
ncbi:hypothetical protein CJF31_00001544 [Rutstroemia sp. NJR-2017a BVV2]|nr:hypothetical protein CJF31_00001544 [Rutstroemia sp. NJR-2017a BVV2]